MSNKIAETFILQWNPNGILNKQEELKLIIKELHPLIILIQESHLKPSDKLNIKNYKSCRCDFTENLRASGGVLTLIHENILADEINLASNLQLVTIKIQSNILPQITICNLYIPEHFNLKTEDLDQILDQIRPPYIIAGDFNAHHPIWGSLNISRRGNIIEQFVLRNPNVTLLNDGHPTHITLANGNLSAIDLTFSSSCIATKLNWEVHDDLNFSDHFPIKTSLNISQNQEYSQDRVIWNVKRANWPNFEKELKIYNEIATPNIDQMISEFYRLINDAAEKSIPKTQLKNSNKFPIVHWWTEEIKKAIKARKKQLRIYKRTKRIEDFIAFKKSRAVARNLIRLTKKQSWENFILSINSSTPSQEIWQKIKKLNNNREISKINAIIVNNNIITKQKDIADSFARYFSTPNSLNIEKDSTFIEYKRHMEQYPINYENNTAETTYNLPFTYNELENCINELKPNSTPGPDHIHNLMLLHLNERAKVFLLKIFNHMWDESYIPPEWKHAEIVPIFKTGKNKTNLSSYRPISLISTTMKLFEKLVANRLRWLLTSKSLIHKTQTGFQKNRSTMDNIVQLDSEIKNAIATKEYAVCVFFDLEQAFDRVWRYKILKIMKEWQLKGNLPRIIQQFLYNRFISVKLNSVTSKKYPLENGVPQGSVLSCLLFLMAINDINEYIPKSLNISLYADDLAIYSKSPNIKFLIKIIQRAINNLKNWSETNGLYFSKSKTEYIIFNRRKLQRNGTKLYMDNEEIKQVTHKNFLGVIFEEKHKWKKHIEMAKVKGIQALNIMKILSSKEYSSDRKVLLNLYKMFVRSKIEYGSIVYNSATASLLKKLDVVQNLGIRLATGAFRTSPIESLHVEAHILPLQYRRNINIFKYATKVSMNEQNPAYHYLMHPLYERLYRENNKPKPIGVYLKNLCDEYTIDIQIFETIKKITNNPIPPWTDIKNEINDALTLSPKRTTTVQEYKNQYQEIIEQNPEYLQLFTDGSYRKTEGSGSAFVFQNIIKKFKLHPINSNYTAELIALLMALKYIENHNLNKIIIFTDSYSTIQAIKSKSTNESPFTTEIKEILQANASIKIAWIPGHSNILGNETADEAAKDAATNGRNVDLISPNDLINHFTNKTFAKWNEKWNTSPQKLQKIKTSIKLWKTSNYPKNRKFERTLCRLRIGHTKLTHTFLMKRYEPPICDQCQVENSVEHILSKCTKYKNNRKKHKIKRDLKDIICDDPEEINKVYKFLKDSELLSEF